VHREPILRINNISKSYNGVKALKDVSFNIYKGEIIGLLGANGAGKSTLLKIIGGVEKPSGGQIFLEDSLLDNITPHIAKQKGIMSVYQELNLFLNMTVAENLFIGRENKGKIGTLDWKVTRSRAEEILASLGLDICPDSEVSCLSVAKQHLVEIARALSEKPKLLLLDEPTAALSEKEIKWLFSKVRQLAQEGTTVVYVSHRLDEVTELCERCVILRDGSLAHELSGEFNKDTIVSSMIGHSVELLRPENKVNENEIVFECQNLRFRNTVKDISFQLRKGEILGIAGLVGAGRTELLRVIFGVDKMSSGKMWVNGNEITINSPKDAMNNSIALVPEDRKMEGLFLEENVRFNIASSTMEKRTSWGIINRKEEKQVVHKAATSVQMDTSRMEHLVKLLSGGNQQKAVIAKTLLIDADILILDEPTRGVDIGAREEIYEIIKQLANDGKAILLVSSDWEELVFLSDRMLVMAEGRITGELTADEVTEEKIMHLSTIADTKVEACDVLKSSPIKRIGKNIEAHKGFNVFEMIASFYRDNNIAILVFMLIGLMAFGLIFDSSFGKWMNIRNMMGQSMPLFLLTMGQFIVIIAGGLDLSSGAMLAASSVLGITIMIHYPDNVLLGIIAMLAFGLVVGAINALLVIKAKVDSFVVTLGMSIVLTGVTLIITKKPIGPSPKILRQIVNSDIQGIPYVLFIIVALLLIFTILLKYTAQGRQFYAVGENAKGSYWAGLPVEKTKFISFMISSLMAVLAGMFLLGRTGAGDPALGNGMELNAIAAALIGGALLGGGRGKLGGVICGVLVLVLLENILSLMQVELWYQEVIEGVLLLAIIISYELRVKKRKYLSCLEQ
jgi:ABC-type sugar transport system ATPase subunit/ribose/xylose/arabinose/galactoside ABC-type transport system permease subunit